MTKLILTLFIIWIAWKALQAILEEIQGRMDDRRGEEQNIAMPDVTGSSKARLPTGRVSTTVTTVKRPDARRISSEERELARLLQEAQERKRQMESVRGPRPVSSPASYARTDRTQPRPVESRPRVAHVPTTQQRVVVREYFEAEVPPATRSETHPSTRKPRKVRDRAGHDMGEMPRSTALIAGLGSLDLHDMRRGVILAEILGPPKGLGDIDSRIV